MKFILRSTVVVALAAIAGCASQPAVIHDTILYPPLPQEPKLQFLTYIASEKSLKEAEQDSQFRDFVVGKQEIPALKLSRPFSLDHLPGRLLVLDKGYRKVIDINLETGMFKFIDDQRGGPLRNALSIHVDEDSKIYVVDKSRAEVLVYNEYREFEKSFKTGADSNPIEVVTVGRNLYVSDVAKNTVEMFDKATGEHVTTFGSTGEGRGMLVRPTNMAVDSENNILVVDTQNSRVQKFSPKGDFISQYGYLGTGLGAMVRPKGLDIDREGNFYIVDGAFEMVTIYDSVSGMARMNFADGGGRGGLYLPTDVHIDYDNIDYFRKYADPNFEIEYLVYVANGRAAVNVYGFGKWTGALTRSRPVD